MHQLYKIVKEQSPLRYSFNFFLTAKKEPSLRQKIATNGVDDFISKKPFKAKDFIRINSNKIERFNRIKTIKTIYILEKKYFT
jgi:hypothetical protein